MRYRVEIAPAAQRQLRKLKKLAQKRFLNSIEALAEDPRPAGPRKLSGTEELYRIREGDFRIIYEIRDEVLLVLVVKVGHRKDVYKRIG